MKKVFDDYASGNHMGVCPAEPAAHKAFSVLVQQRNIDSGNTPEMICAHKLSTREDM